MQNNTRSFLKNIGCYSRLRLKRIYVKTYICIYVKTIITFFTNNWRRKKRTRLHLNTKQNIVVLRQHTMHITRYWIQWNNRYGLKTVSSQEYVAGKLKKYLKPKYRLMYIKFRFHIDMTKNSIPYRRVSVRVVGRQTDTCFTGLEPIIFTITVFN